MSSQQRIDLLIPGLFGPVPVHPNDLPATPALAHMLGRADGRSSPGSNPVSVLLECFGIEPAPGQEPPSAPFCRLADLPEAETAGYVMHADPVHLRPDRDRLLLFDAHHLALGREESDALVDLFNGHFARDGMRLEAASPQRWYLHVERPPRLRTVPLYSAIGRSISKLLPEGEDATAWARFLNEAQMLFHHAPENQVREREGQPTVSGIWPWGGGQLPATLLASGYEHVYAADALALGLAAATNVPSGSVPEDAMGLIESASGGSVLMFWDGLMRPVLDADSAGWRAQIERLEQWMASLLADSKQLGELRIRIYPCNGECYEIGAWSLRRFWRRPFALGARLGRTDRT